MKIKDIAKREDKTDAQKVADLLRFPRYKY